MPEALSTIQTNFQLLFATYSNQYWDLGYGKPNTHNAALYLSSYQMFRSLKLKLQKYLMLC